MSQFRFRLQSILEYRQSLVDRTRMELAALQMKLRQEEAALAELEAAERAALAKLQKAQRGMIDLPRVTQMMDHLHGLEARIVEQGILIDQRRAELELLHGRLVDMSRELKAMEKLRERQAEAFAQEGLRRERIETSEAAALQFRQVQSAWAEREAR